MSTNNSAIYTHTNLTARQRLQSKLEELVYTQAMLEEHGYMSMADKILEEADEILGLLNSLTDRQLDKLAIEYYLGIECVLD